MLIFKFFCSGIGKCSGVHDHGDLAPASRHGAREREYQPEDHHAEDQHHHHLPRRRGPQYPPDQEGIGHDQQQLDPQRVPGPPAAARLPPHRHDVRHPGESPGG